VADISEAGLRIHSVHPIQIGTELRSGLRIEGEFTFESIEEVARSFGQLSIEKETGKGIDLVYISQRYPWRSAKVNAFPQTFAMDQKNRLDHSYPEACQQHSINGEKEHAKR